jgi:hypothetical protein
VCSKRFQQATVDTLSTVVSSSDKGGDVLVSRKDGVVVVETLAPRATADADAAAVDPQKQGVVLKRASAAKPAAAPVPRTTGAALVSWRAVLPSCVPSSCASTCRA